MRMKFGKAAQASSENLPRYLSKAYLTSATVLLSLKVLGETSTEVHFLRTISVGFPGDSVIILIS